MFVFDAPPSRGTVAAGGALAVTLGILALVWPGITVGVAVALFAIYCFADAITKTVSIFRSDETTGDRMWLILIVLVDVAAGIVAIAYPGITAGALVIVVGLWAVITGGMELTAAWQLRGTHTGSGWHTVGGLLSIAAGVVLMIWPDIGAVSLAVVFGIYLVAYGTTLLVAAIATPSERDIGDALA